MTPIQHALIAKIQAALQADTRVLAAWLSGSLGRGTEDEWSDVDVLALVEGSALEIGQSYARDPKAVTEVVFTQPLYGGAVVHSITPDWQRFDISFVEASQMGRYDPAHLHELFDRTGFVFPPPVPSPVPPQGERVLAIVTEFIRVLGLAPTVFGREEYVTGLAGAGHLRTGLVNLMIEENGIEPADRGGALHLNRLITEEQRRVLEALPPLAPTRGSLLASHAELARLFFPRAKALSKHLGMPWPFAFEAATRRHLERELGLRI